MGRRPFPANGRGRRFGTYGEGTGCAVTGSSETGRDGAHPAGPEGVSHARPAGVDDATVAAVGKLDKAFETFERARGHLYSFHQLSGTADLQLGDAVAALRDAGHGEHADALERDMVGRNVLDGRWTFQVVEEYERTYAVPFRDAEKAVRDALLGGRRHVFEAEMKERERSAARPGHEARPEAGADPAVARD